MDKDSKKVLDDKYGVPDEVEEFAAKIAYQQDNPAIHQLAKAFPDKTYGELEKYRDADRHQEAQQIPLTESQKKQEELEPIQRGVCVTGALRKDRQKSKRNEGEEQDNPTLWELAKEHKVSYADAVPIQENMRLKKEAKIEAEKIKKDITPMDTMKKRAQEAEGELSIMKGIETNRVKEAQARTDYLQAELDRIKKDNNDLYNRVAELIEIDEAHQRLNGKLQVRIAELEDENKKLHDHLESRIEAARKAGL